MSDQPRTTLDTGEPITVQKWDNEGPYRYVATAMVADLPGPVDRHGAGITSQEAVSKLRAYVACLRRRSANVR
jgi:hypothetical protein